jgi:hypothetical protein
MTFETATDLDDSGTMVILFRKGGSYTWDSFPAIEWARFKAADSVGGYFNAYIKGNY